MIITDFSNLKKLKPQTILLGKNFEPLGIISNEGYTFSIEMSLSLGIKRLRKLKLKGATTIKILEETLYQIDILNKDLHTVDFWEDLSNPLTKVTIDFLNLNSNSCELVLKTFITLEELLINTEIQKRKIAIPIY